MAHIDDNKGKKSVSVDLNIVPFIDLMSVLIIFLLITAVWTQVSMIQLGTSVYGKKTGQEAEPPPPRAEIPFRVIIKESGYQVVVGRDKKNIAKRNGDYNRVALSAALVQIKELYPEKKDAILAMSDNLRYELLINGMDALNGAGFPEISIETGGQ